jgi:hypothetical protein
MADAKQARVDGLEDVQHIKLQTSKRVETGHKCLAQHNAVSHTVRRVATTQASVWDTITCRSSALVAELSELSLARRGKCGHTCEVTLRAQGEKKIVSKKNVRR